MPKIKILHLIKSLGRGGAEMLLPETLKMHDQTRFEFYYIYFLPWKNQMESSIKEAGGSTFCFTAGNNIELILKANKVQNFCMENGIDVIHCHLPWAGFLGRRIHKAIGIPVLYTEHNLQERYHPVTRFINKITFNHQNLAFGVSQDVSNSIKLNIRPNVPVRTLLNGVNTSSFRKSGDMSVRKSLDIPPDALVIGNIAVFRFQKRLKEWLQLLSQVTRSNQNVYGILVGAGPLEKEVREELMKLGLEERVFLPGLKTNVKPYLEAMDIFMMSSSFEGLPIALLEAMSMECAVVATGAGGIKEVIRDGEDGFVCDVKNWQELAELCKSLIDSPYLLQRYKVAARVRVAEAFSLENLVIELEKEYQEIYTSSLTEKNAVPV